MKDDVTNKICEKCHDVLEECQCTEAQKQAEWHDSLEEANIALLGKFQTGEVTL